MEKSDWHKWRQEGLGASDAPAVMGVSPWLTRFQLWEIKTGLAVHDQSNFATRRGNELEPKARATYELMHDMAMPIAFVEHPKLPFIRASLDGYNRENGIILEIKCPGADDHATALAGKVPEKYIPQLQHQLLASCAREVHYYSFDGNAGALVKVKPDLAYQDTLLQELCDFWQLVKTKTPPDLTDKDYVKVEDITLAAMLDQYRELDMNIKAMTATRDTLKEQITTALPHPNVICGGARLTKIYRVGAIDYSKISVLDGVNLEPYRKKGSSYYTFTWPKK